MKKILFSLPCFIFLFSVLLFPSKACYGCNNYSHALTYHACNASMHSAVFFRYDPSTLSSPIYSAYTIYNGYVYFILRSETPFSGCSGYGFGSTIASSDSVAIGSDEYKSVWVKRLEWLIASDFSMETYKNSQPLPKFIEGVNINSEAAIASLDLSLFTLAVNADGSIFQPPTFDPFSAEYDDDVPVPQVITKFNVVAGVTTPIISFTNGSTDYNVVVYGRWNSINDVTLRQEKLRWVYDYSSLIHGDLECWVSDEDNRTSRENFDFFSDPHFTDTYQAFLLKYPLSERNITNDPTLFEKLTGYNEALHNFTELYMNLPNNAYSKPDFFFRYYYRDEAQNIHYSRWAHLTFPLIPPGENGFKTTTDQLWKGNLDYQVANKPLTSEEVLDVDTYFDTDQTKYNIMNNQQSYDLDEIDWTMSLSNLQSITSVFGQMPAFVATVFSCYPAWMVQLVGATITILCALAIYHGIRG